MILSFGAWSGLSLIWAQSPLISLHHTLAWSIYVIYLVVFLSLLRLENGIRIITGAFAVIAMIIGLSCLFDYLAIVDFAFAEGPIRLRYGKFAELLVTMSPLLWVTTLYVRGRRRFVFLLLVAILSWITVMLSLSKGAFLSGIIGFLILFAGCAFFSIRTIRKRVFVMAAVWLAITLGVQIVFSTASSIPSTTDYITGNVDKTRSTSTMRVFTWSVARQMASNHWLIGVGADNFGLAFNEARVNLDTKQLTAYGEEIAEDYMVERAHNEFLQIFAELGIVGMLLFAGALGYFGFLTVKRLHRNRYRLSPVFWAAIAGMAAFFASSMVSSFSFRAMQNGLVFFMVFAVAVNELGKLSKNKMARSKPAPQPLVRKSAVALTIVFAGLTAIHAGTRAAAEYIAYRALISPRFEDSEWIFDLASRLDPGDAAAYVAFGQRCDAEGKHDLAAAMLRQAIDRGGGVTQTYSLLAKYQTLAGRDDAAVDTFEEATSIFPRSVFMRVRYAVFLEEHGRAADAAAQLEIARDIDLKQANGWHSIIKDGSVAAFHKARNDPETAFPADLRPDNAIRQYLDETNISDVDKSGSDPGR